MSDEITKIEARKFNKAFGTSLTIAGINGLRSSYNNLGYIIRNYTFLNYSVKQIVDIFVGNEDYNYYFTSWENWQEMLDTIWGIVKNFNWEEERFDCENRAMLVSALCSLIYRINTCSRIYCEVRNINNGQISRHYANLIVVEDGGVYLFDCDNGGRRIKLEKGKPIIMSAWEYTFFSTTFGKADKIK